MARGQPPQRPARGDAEAKPLLQRGARGYANWWSNVALTACVFLLLQGLTASTDWASFGPGSDNGVVGDIVEACRLMAGNFLAPFSKTLARAVFPPELINMRAMSIWVPVVLACYMCAIGFLGRWTLTTRSAAVVFPYIVLSAAHLVWQSELNGMLRRVAQAEDLPDLKALGKEAQMSDLHGAFFDGPYEHFSAMFTESKCRVASSAAQPLRLECDPRSTEGKMLPIVVPEFCRARSAAGAEAARAFDRRVEACEAQGREAKVMPETRRPVDTVFCRCRAAAYDCVRSACPWFSFAWCAQLAAVWVELYFAVERNLESMDVDQRRQVLCFGVVGFVALVCRAVLLADYFDDDVIDLSLGR